MPTRVPAPARCLAVGILAVTTLGACSSDPLPRREVRIDPRPPNREVPLSATVRGLREAVAGRSCREVAALVHSSAQPLDDRACREQRRRLGAFRGPRAASYGSGAVIDFRTADGQHRTAVLALDANRRYRLLFVLNLPRATVGTRPSPRFDRAARATTQALFLSDCTRFTGLVHREVGIGTASPEEVCERLPLLGVAEALRGHPRTRARPLGGNRYLAFYGLRTSAHQHHTMVMARQPLADQRPGRPVRYRFITAVGS